VGNKGCVDLAHGTFSKCPEMHRRVLEISPAIETEHGKQDRLSFHFSEDNYGYYWLFYYSNNLKTPLTVALQSLSISSQRIAAPHNRSVD
jgi:hypothetical protein